MRREIDAIAGWMQQKVAEARCRGIAVGLSGGIDSAVVIGLAARAVPGRTLGVFMPCHSDPRDESDAQLAAQYFQVPVIRVDLGPTYDRLVGELDAAVAQLPDGQRPAPSTVDPKAALPLANVKPRLRMTCLYFVANTMNYLVAGTGNRSELTIGYFTKYGDGGVDILPIGRLLKSEVREMARELGVPSGIIEKPPSAGLWIGQTDEGEMGFTYAELEAYLTQGPAAVSSSVAERIDLLSQTSHHKRAVPPLPD